MNSFCIIGLGKFGTSLAQALVKYDKQVMVIDRDTAKVTAIADSITNAVIGDATNEALLRASGVADYDCAVVCTTENTSDTILITILLKELGVGRVISRAVGEGHRKVLEHVGTEIILPEQDAGEKLAFQLSKGSVREFIQFDGYKVVELDVPDEWAGKTLVGLDLRRKFGVNVIAVTIPERGVEVSPGPSHTFVIGETATMIGSDRDIDRLTAQIGK